MLVCGRCLFEIAPFRASHLNPAAAGNRAYDDEDGDEEVAKDDKASHGQPQTSSTVAAAAGEGAEEEEEEARPRKRTIRWLDEAAGDIESYDVKRQKAVEAGLEAQTPMSAWALKLKEEQKAFAEAMASMKGIQDE